MERENFRVGMILKHFKRGLSDNSESTSSNHLYKYLGEVIHADTDEVLIAYQALYEPYKTFVRNKDSFYSLVDKEKYPDATQQYRFELYKF